MPAPRLLDKKTIHSSLAQERQRGIDEEVKLSESILALRETKAKEMQELEEMRVNTLKAIQLEIVRKQRENDALSGHNTILREERIRLETPVDLTQAWEQVEGLKQEYDSLGKHLLKRESDITSREANVQRREEGLTIREKEIQRSEIATDENLRQAEQEREEAKSTNINAQVLLFKIELKESEHNVFARKKTEELERRESALFLQEEQNERDHLDINSQKTLLADRRATLERGFAELRRKQQ